MAKLILRQEAINDLNDIWDYTASYWSENQADKYYGMIRAACKEIAKESLIAKNYNEIDSSLFGYRIGKHIIFYYKVQDDEIKLESYRK